MSFLMMSVAPEYGPALPEFENLLSGVAFGGFFGLIVLAPSVYGQVWGARLIASSTAALLTMVELITATVSAFLLIGTSLNSTSMIGGLIIAGAAILDLTAPETRAG